ncbi:MAG: CHAT domain-containing protein, partial [Microcystaceae cyanobacterium]
LFAGITENQGRSQPLLYVEQELNSVQSQTAVTPLLNQNFVPNQLQRRLIYNRFEIVHLASHGRFSSQLQDTFIDTWEKPLNVTELVNLLQRSNPTGDNAINLLILSACETAIGDQRAALGLAGMAVRSGAKSTLATLWSVNDEATAKFMGEFYRQFVIQKVSKAEALRQTQLALLKDPWFKHPFYWGAYILVGDWL